MLRTAATSLEARIFFSPPVRSNLALGTGATTGIFSVANAVLLERLPFAQPDRLAMVAFPSGLTGDGEPEQVDGMYASHDFFPILGVQPIAGRVHPPGRHPRRQ